MPELMRYHLRLLTFRATAAELERLDRRHLVLGLAWTWVVGIGRYWDHPRAALLQYLGVGSVIYVCVLAALVWLVVLPLRPACWSYPRVLTYITLTAPPAVLYAIPVERFTPLEVAQGINVWFLLVVALWRVALYVLLLLRLARLSIMSVCVATLTPLLVILVALTTLNLEHAVFEIMAGIGRDSPPPTAADDAYAVVSGLGLLSLVSAIPVLLVYWIQAALVWEHHRKLRSAPAGASAGGEGTAEGGPGAAASGESDGAVQ